MEKSASTHAAPAAPGQEKPRVLYVDDEPVNLSNFHLVFKHDYEVVACTDGTEALNTFKKDGNFAVVIADQRMPGLSGVELLEQIYSIDPDPIRIILTGFADLHDIINAINRGHIYHYVRKPWKEEDLRLTLLQALNSFRLTKENKQLCRRLIQVAEEERKRIANDLHDEFGQVLPAIRGSFKRLREALPDPPAAMVEELDNIGLLIQRMGEITREAAHALRPDTLDRLGLQETIQWMRREFSRRHPEILLEYQVKGQPRPIPPEIETILFRVFQESFNNIEKHAKATRVTVQLIFSHPQIILAVDDNGIGMALDQSRPESESAIADSGLGLRAMQERVTAAQGELTIHSAPGDGTSIRAALSF